MLTAIASFIILSLYFWLSKKHGEKQKKLQRIRLEGQLAFQNLLPPDSPYPKDSLNHKLWAEGYLTAKKQREKLT